MSGSSIKSNTIIINDKSGTIVSSQALDIIVPSGIISSDYQPHPFSFQTGRNITFIFYVNHTASSSSMKNLANNFSNACGGSSHIYKGIPDELYFYSQVEFAFNTSQSHASSNPLFIGKGPKMFHDQWWIGGRDIVSSSENWFLNFSSMKLPISSGDDDFNLTFGLGTIG